MGLLLIGWNNGFVGIPQTICSDVEIRVGPILQKLVYAYMSDLS